MDVGTRNAPIALPQYARGDLPEDFCACGDLLVFCQKCRDLRCLSCDPYDERDTCGR